MPNLLIAALLGSIQGLTEFLPVSSTAHLIILQRFFNLDQSLYGLTFDIFTSLGTTIALLLYFWRDWIHIFRLIRIPTAEKPLKGEEKLPWWILGITILVSLAGLFLEQFVEDSFRNLEVIAAALIVVGLVMLVAERQAAKVAKKAELTWTSAYLVGISQIVAFIPGVSRSGATISTGLFLGLDRAKTARFSFLLSAPIFMAAFIKRAISASDQLGANLTGSVGWFYLVAFLTAALVGYFTIHYLLEYLKRRPLTVFVYYRFLLAGVLLFLIYT